MSNENSDSFNRWSRIGMLAMLEFILFYVLWILSANAMYNAGQGNPGLTCMTSTMQSMTAVSIYSADHDGRLPPASRWVDLASPYVPSEEVFRCPNVKNRRKDRYGNAMNINASCIQGDRKDAFEFPVLFDSILLARNASSGLHGFAFRGKNGKATIGWLDGHASGMTPEKLERALPRMRALSESIHVRDVMDARRLKRKAR